jgi:hypothetical protein
MNASQLEARDYSFCQVFYRDPYACRTFVVGVVGKAERTEAAKAFALARWGEPCRVLTYPRNYIKDARRLFAAGLHD